jgi:hypothetical protein
MHLEKSKLLGGREPLVQNRLKMLSLKGISSNKQFNDVDKRLAPMWIILFENKVPHGPIL